MAEYSEISSYLAQAAPMVEMQGGTGKFSVDTLVKLIVYLSVSLVFSFLCSVAEAVLLSVNGGYIDSLKRQGVKAGDILTRFKTRPDEPLAAILTVNTIAHTVGAAGVGHEAAVLFGDRWLGVSSGVMTLLILIGSEIIPKTIGANHWRRLAAPTAHGVRAATWALKPLIRLLLKFTKDLANHEGQDQSRAEIESVVWRASKSGTLSEVESAVLRNVFDLRRVPVRKIMTPRVVVYRLPEDLSVGAYRRDCAANVFSRIPVHEGMPDRITGFVLRSDILSAPDPETLLRSMKRELPVVAETLPVSALYADLIDRREHLAMVVNEYGDFVGIASLEDVIETLIGREIVDELDPVEDMRRQALKLRRKGEWE
ncbi:MAG: DUF21 domain-containing protein [Verrucomicrobiae bacterium]|nr:DUF21 domain-containing protein [Verrucomicrobiae bacterium]MCP5542205.1 DUF21 domain-containing protein [Akkermansiaceae bacterium]